MGRLQEEKRSELMGYVIHSYTQSGLRGTVYPPNEQNEKEAKEFLRQLDFRLKLTRMLNAIEDDQEAATEAQRQLVQDPTLEGLRFEDVLPRLGIILDQEEASKQPPPKEKPTEPINPNVESREEKLERLVDGTYHMKEGKLVRGPAEQRTPSSYINWTAANADPEDLEKHKTILHRQYFGGPFWKDKVKPRHIEEDMFDYDPDKIAEIHGTFDFAGLPPSTQGWKEAKG
jgi:hypothetical protein